MSCTSLVDLTLRGLFLGRPKVEQDWETELYGLERTEPSLKVITMTISHRYEKLAVPVV